MQYAPARTLPLDEVKERVRERLVASRAAELAKKEGMEKLAAWKAESGKRQACRRRSRCRGNRRRSNRRQVIEAALRADPAALPALVGVDLGEQGYAVVKVNKVVPREAPAPEMAKQEAQQYGQLWATAEGLAYYELLKERFKVQVKVPKPSGTEALVN